MPVSTPHIEGEQATFLWEGDDPPRLTGDFTHWGLDLPPLALEPRGAGLWGRTVRFPLDAYIEYRFERDGIRLADPRNPRRVENGTGDENNFFTMPDWTASPYLVERPDVPHGEVTEHDLDFELYFGTPSRTVYLYRPPAPGPVPLLVVLDGQDYLRRGRLATIVDNLIAAGRIRPIALAMPDHGGIARTVEYACNDATVAFILRQVVPLAREHLDLGTGDDGDWGLMGASMGGLMALYAALRVPETFGRVLCQSGAFAAPHLYHRSVVADLIRLVSPPPLRIWLDVARHEWHLRPDRDMADLLRTRGYEIAFEEHSGGHNFTSWRNTVHRGLEYLFPAI